MESLKLFKNCNISFPTKNLARNAYFVIQFYFKKIHLFQKTKIQTKQNLTINYKSMNTSTYNYTKTCVYLVVHHWTISKVPNLKHSAFEILIDDILYMENLVI